VNVLRDQKEFAEAARLEAQATKIRVIQIQRADPKARPAG
jgi:hypothetical protein